MSDEASPLADGPPARGPNLISGMPGRQLATGASAIGADHHLSKAAEAAALEQLVQGIAAASCGKPGISMDSDRQRQQAERMRASVIAAMQRSRALTVEHARRLESRGDRAGAELEWERLRRADEMIRVLRSAAGGMSMTEVSDAGRCNDDRG